jgi:erythronate-4-phosphate dehydrogenase
MGALLLEPAGSLALGGAQTAQALDASERKVMLIAYDSQICMAKEHLQGLGELMPVPGYELGPKRLHGAEALLVRSTTLVDSALLEGTRVRFVGSVAAGTDHVDEPYLAREGIAFASAPGCNADSVACYVTAALLGLRERGLARLEGQSMGIVGMGQVGSRVARQAAALGSQVICCDPPLKRAGMEGLHPLEDALSCDLVSLHVPLIRDGIDKTHGMIGAGAMAMLPKGAFLINTCRGAVMDESALKVWLKSGRAGGALLDVWQDEPEHDPVLETLALLATPHIAGHSLDGKAQGTRMVCQALASWLGRRTDFDPPRLAAGPLLKVPEGLGGLDAAHSAIGQVYDPWQDDKQLRQAMAECENQGEAFTRLRLEYPVRRDPSGAVLAPGPGVREHASLLQSLGFSLPADL